jgi:GIY-YIG catalytic domain
MMDRKELKKQYKGTVQPMGIYQIRNIVNGKILIGSSKNLKGKENSFKFMFQFQQNPGHHINKKFFDEYSKYGAENFVFEILDQLEPKDDPAYDYTGDLKVLEELWLEKLRPYGENGYNELIEPNPGKNV